MIIRMAVKEDIDGILQVVKEGKEFMKAAGLSQWQGEYPAAKDFMLDIENNELYVVESKDNEDILGVTAFTLGGEPVYDEIREGTWRTDGEYGVIHRMVFGKESRGKGLSGKLLEYCEEVAKEKGINCIRIDTATNNKAMLSFIERNGFEYCGIVDYAGGPKACYDKII